MNKEKTIAIIVEGDSYEGKIWRNIQSIFFCNRLGKLNCKVITLPITENIYMLWNTIKEDEYLDIIEVIRERSKETAELLEGYTRESFSEIYLLFDYDSQQNNLKKGGNPNEVLLNMIDTFDNETENGKMYISYPMAEAIRDYKNNTCLCYSGSCYVSNGITDYKNRSGDNNPKAHLKKYTENDWRDIINIYRSRVACLFGGNEAFSIEDCRHFETKEVLNAQLQFSEKYGKTIVMSGFPLFLIEYFPIEYIEGFIGDRPVYFDNCDMRLFL